MVVAFAPGRVNLIGDHTDYTGGWVLPLAIQLGTTVSLEPGGPDVRLRSESEPEEVTVPIDVADPAICQPPWARYVAGVVAVTRPRVGGFGTVTTTLPVGAGLSSSAALEVAVALALGFEGSPLQLARSCQQAEQRASGVPCGIMDQLVSSAGVEGHALLIDCGAEQVTPVAWPPDVEIVAVHSGRSRALAGGGYAAKRAGCVQAEAHVGPLNRAEPAEVETIPDPDVRGLARHVVSENRRVLDFVAALAAGDLAAAGGLMRESHASLRDDFGVSTPELDDLVADLTDRPGVYGARLTGAGFGGCVVALTRPGVLDQGWKLRPSGGARLLPA